MARYQVHVVGRPVEVVLLVDGIEVDAYDIEQTHEFLVNTAILTDGAHEVVLESRGLFRRTARHDTSLQVDNTPPRLTLARSSQAADQGRTLGVFVRVDELVAVAEATFLDYTWDLERLPEGLLRGVKGVPVTADPGSWPLTVRAVDYAGNVAVGTWSVMVGETDFPRGGYVRLSPKKKTDMGEETLTKRANEARWAAYTQDLGIPLADGVFQRPVTGRITSRFGKVRRYNTGVVRHHLGTDMRGALGSPVVVAQDGLVTLAEELHIYGKVVIVKHGPNISTSYNHLSQITVDVGQEVTRGMKIGRVGTTGQSTGPHLHWGMAVGGTAVAAEEWTERDFSQPLAGDFEPGVPPDPGLSPVPEAVANDENPEPAAG
jgi:murein DD-endopeptidase MepM/ murein hydrolase activator NlpD